MILSKIQILNYLDENFKIRIKKVEYLGNGIVFAHLLYLIDNTFDIQKIYRILQIPLDKDPVEKLQELDIFFKTPHMIDEILKVCQICLDGKIPFDIHKIGKFSYFENLEVVRWLITELEIVRKKKGSKNVLSTKGKINILSKKNSIVGKTDISNSLISDKSINIENETPDEPKTPLSKKKRKSSPNPVFDSPSDRNKEIQQRRASLKFQPTSSSLNSSKENKASKPQESTRKRSESISNIKKIRVSDQIEMKEIDPEKKSSLENTKVNTDDNEKENMKMFELYDNFIKKLENERDFYYDKLVKIEKLIKRNKGIKAIEEVLYKKNETK